MPIGEMDSTSHWTHGRSLSFNIMPLLLFQKPRDENDTSNHKEVKFLIIFSTKIQKLSLNDAYVGIHDIFRSTYKVRK